MRARHRTTSPTTRRLPLALLLLAALLGPQSACGPSYTEEVKGAHNALMIGDPSQAMRLINAQLGVRDMTEMPAQIKDNTTLLLLERATLLQASNNYKMAARDLMAADQELVLLDLSKSKMEDVGKYLYSDDVATYRAAPYERLLLNTLNMINFLALYDLDGARVEARRFRTIEAFYVDAENKTLLPGLVALGNYLAGATFEASRRYDDAVRHYARAWYFGLRDADLKARLRDLYRVTGYTERKLQSAGLDAIAADAKAAGPMGLDAYAEAHQRGDVLAVIQFGMAPYKKAMRVPTSQAMRMSSSRSGQYALTPATRARVAQLSSSGGLNYVNFPELSTDGLPVRTSSSAALAINARGVSTFLGMDVKTQVDTAWRELAGPLMSAAITRTITRAVVGQAGKASATAAQGGGGAGAAVGVLGWLAALGVQGAMGANDTPDTRCWTTLPAYIRLSRTKLPRGMHAAEVNISGRTQRQTVAVWPDRLNVVNFSRLR